MRCGEKCFYVTMEKDNVTVELPVNARTPVDARKTVRREYGREIEILSVHGRKR
jgi:RNA polymerase-interacting CarD/CdnL/TRCF family regulator